MKKRLPALALSLAFVVAACGGDSGASVSNPWARPSAPGQSSSAVYFDLTVDEDDRLVGATVDASIAERAEIHEVVPAELDHEMGDMSMDDMSMDEMSSMEGSGDMDDMSMDDGDHEMDMGDGAMAMRMQELEDGLELEGGETVTFKPGGYHVMLPVLTEPLEVGDEFEVTLSFENADDVTVGVTVAESAP